MEGGGEDPVAGVVEGATAGQWPGGLFLAGATAVGVAGDHVAGVDLEPCRQLGRRGYAAGGDRVGREVAAEVGMEEAVDTPDPGRNRGAHGGAAGAAEAAAVARGHRPPGALGGPRLAPDRAALGEAVGEAVDGPQHVLVVGRCGMGGEGAEGAHRRRGDDALHARQAQVAVHVVAMGGVDVVAQPNARVGELQLRIAEPGGDAGCGIPGERCAVLEPERGAGESELFEQRFGQTVVVVAGDEDRRAPGHRFSKLLEERLGCVERGGEWQFAQLDDVAEQDEPVGAGELVEQDAADRGVAQQILAEAVAQVQVGDDRGSHRRELSWRGYAVRVSGFSEERLAPANGIEIAYQEIGDPDDEPLLLIMGLAMQMLAWDEAFCTTLAERGFRVVRFDNRDIGRSTHFGDAGVPSRTDMLLGRRRTAAYTLRDMAADTLGLMNHLEIESAHLVGASMGGMIAQTAAIRKPERVRSLVSIMSSTGNRWIGVPAWKAFGTLFNRPGPGRDAAVEASVRTFRTIGSPAYPMDEARLRELAGASYDRSHDRAGIARQLHAVTASGDRTPKLERLRLPATVLHGASDPLIRPIAGRATARALRDSRLRIFDGMGHDLPRDLWPDFVEEITATAHRFAPTNSSSLATSSLRET
jgi:pimeloyl-ACP methyl ester carboxylesterase